MSRETGTDRVVRVLVVGSSSGDDAIGWRLLDGFEAGRVAGLEARRVRNPLQLLDAFDGADAVVLVDACRTGCEPGTVQISRWPDHPFAGEAGGLAHGFDLITVLQLAGTLGRLPRGLWLFAVEAGDTAVESGLGARLEGRLDALRGGLRALVERLHDDPAGAEWVACGHLDGGTGPGGGTGLGGEARR